MQGFIYSLLLALTSALAFVAYRHRKAFEKIAAVLYGVSLLTCLGINLWNIAMDVAHTAVIRAVGYQQPLWDKIDHAIDQLQIPSGVLFTSFFLWMAYLTVLRFPSRDLASG